MNVEYDARGNLRAVTSPKGARTSYYTDVLGRDSVTESPIHGNHVQRQEITYKPNTDLVETVRTSAPILHTADSLAIETVVVNNEYDSEGNLLSTTRSSVPKLVVDPLTNTWFYDRAGRKVAEVAPDLQVDRFYYDPAGNLTKISPRRRNELIGDTVISMAYDALNRLVKRWVPAVLYQSRTGKVQASGSQDTVAEAAYPRYPRGDTAGYRIPLRTDTLAYDGAGRLILANNQDAEVSRTYNPNGSLRSETSRIRSVAAEAVDSSAHSYTLQYEYDRDGRRTALVLPSGLGLSNDRIRYAYDRATAQLDSVTDPMGQLFELDYTRRGELSAIWRKGQINLAQFFYYDADGNLEEEDAFNGQALRGIVYTHDLRGKIVRSVDYQGTRDTLWARYSGLGQLVEGGLKSNAYDVAGRPLSYAETRRFRADALGNTTATRSSNEYKQPEDAGFLQPFINQGSTADHDEYRVLDPGTGRLLSIRQSGTTRVDTVHYDAAGNTVFETQSNTDQDPQTGLFYSDRASYYGADGTPRATDMRDFDARFGTFHAAFEEYGSDALGRRVLVRARRYCTGEPNPTCNLSWVTRTVWDGSSELYEIRVPESQPESDVFSPLPVQDGSDAEGAAQHIDPNPFYGRVLYTHGLAVDRPLSVTRMNYVSALDSLGNTETSAHFFPAFSIVPLWSARGEADIGAIPDEVGARCMPHNTDATVNCVNLGWPGQRFAYQRRNFQRSFWHGSLLEYKQTAVGTEYMRNRYYDPAKGQFTQEDPIGLAGGLNLYGFADGDPVGYSDPFGLSPQMCPPVCPLPGLGPVPMPTPEMVQGLARSLGEIGDVLADAASAALNVAQDKLQVKFVTYTRANPATGQVYSGRTSGVGDPQAIVNARAAGHPSRLAGFGPAVVDRWATGAQGYAAIRGREQQLIDATGGAISEGGTSANLIRGVSRRNPLAGYYDRAATGMFGPIP